MGVPGEKAYYPSEEFLWDAGRDSTPKGLYTALASKYGLTPDNLLLAKHLPDKHTWMPISNWVRRERENGNRLFVGKSYRVKIILE